MFKFSSNFSNIQKHFQTRFLFKDQFSCEAALMDLLEIPLNHHILKTSPIQVFKTVLKNCVNLFSV